jgi:tetratricopeptide (TPR) repeat protein
MPIALPPESEQHYSFNRNINEYIFTKHQNYNFGMKTKVLLNFNWYLLLSFLVVVIYSCKSDSNNKVESSGNPEIDALTQQISKNPDNPELYFQRAKLYMDNSTFDRAILDMQKAISIDSLNPNYYHTISDAYLDYYNPKEAINAMLKVMSLYPERVPSLLKMSELKYILEDYDGSILTLNEVARLDPQNGEAYFMLGMNFRALNDIERAINAFQTAVEMDSGLTDAWITLGEIFEEKKDPKALKFYESAILSDPKSMQALHAKAFYLQNQGDIAGAQNIYRNIITTDKNYTDAYLNSGLLYLDMDSIQRAFEQFDLLAGVAPTYYMGFYMRGVVNEKKGDKAAALRDYESAFNLNNKDKKVQEALSALKNQIN